MAKAKSSAKETPMMQQFYSIKKDHPDKILFYRMGDFYEMFGDDAVIASKILQIQLTKRNKNAENSIPLCGLPYHAYDQYLNKLTAAGYKVAICEQTEDPAKAKGLVKREVVRVITPGTTISPELIEANQNSYLASISLNFRKKQLGISFCDLSTGEFETDQITGKDQLSRALELIYLYQPKEILIANSKTDNEQTLIDKLIKEVETMLPYAREKSIFEFRPSYLFDFESGEKELLHHFKTNSLAGFGIESQKAGVAAAGALLQYLKETQMDALTHITSLRIIKKNSRMILDESTIRNLELFDSYGPAAKEHTLLGMMDKTETPMGSRLLKRWLSTPLLNKNEIEERHATVEELKNDYSTLEAFRNILSNIADLERIIARIAMPLASINDFVKLRAGIEALPEFSQYFNRLKSKNGLKLNKQFDDLSDIYSELEKKFLPEPATKPKEGGFINDGVDERLDALRDLSKNGKQHLANLEVREKEKTGITNLKVKYNKVFGYYIEISNASKHLAPEHYIRKQTLVNGERFITDELKELEESILSAEDELKDLEYRLFNDIRENIKLKIGRIRKTAMIIAEIDVFCSLAWLAEMNNYSKPQISDNPLAREIKIVEGRHPVIEAINQEEPFIPNDLELNSDQKYIMLITGPNMGGKSTYMRQVALLSLMAQIGSFVPAREAHLPIFDRIFTRVGASDNLTRGQSTFMVEMNEAAAILNNATSQSLIILDEIGRGTSTFDGISIAWAILEHLHNLKAITLFATHYHELPKLENTLLGVCNYNVSVKEEHEDIVFMRKIIPGQTDKSYGIQVAKLAGLPVDVVNRAKSVLLELEMAEKRFVSLEQTDIKEPESKYEEDQNLQMSFFAPEKSWVDELKKFNVNNSTPLEALEFIDQLQKKL